MAEDGELINQEQPQQPLFQRVYSLGEESLSDNEKQQLAEQAKQSRLKEEQQRVLLALMCIKNIY